MSVSSVFIHDTMAEWGGDFGRWWDHTAGICDLQKGSWKVHFWEALWGSQHSGAWKIAHIRDQTPWASRTMRKGSMLLCDLTPNTSRQPTSICTRVFQTPEANPSRKSFSGLFCIAPTILETRCHQDEGETGCTSIPNRKSVGLYFKHSLSRSLGWCYLKKICFTGKKKKSWQCV